LQEATLNYEASLAEYNLAVREPTKADIAEAQSTIADAEAVLAELLQGPSSADVAGRQAAIDKAQLTLEEKQKNLEDAVLVSPTDGLLLNVNIEPGERVLNEADEAVMVIADVSAYLLKVEVDEIDIGRIAHSQRAEITLDALPDEQLEGRVVDVSPSPLKNDSDGIVMFEVTVAVEAPGGVNLLPGMTATAAVETERFKDAVVIPSRAVQFDRAASPPTIFVEKLNGDGEAARVEVELGLRNGSMTQVVAGLEVGDELIVRTQPGTGSTPEL
jgi:RND family efflux transporter MFP subunit